MGFISSVLEYGRMDGLRKSINPWYNTVFVAGVVRSQASDGAHESSDAECESDR